MYKIEFVSFSPTLSHTHTHKNSFFEPLRAIQFFENKTNLNVYCWIALSEQHCINNNKKKNKNKKENLFHSRCKESLTLFAHQLTMFAVDDNWMNLVQEWDDNEDALLNFVSCFVAIIWMESLS